MTDSSEPYPIDFDALEKGDVISEERVKEIFKTGTLQEQSFALLNLINQIEHKRPDLYPICQKGAVAILRDHEAHEYSVRRHVKIVGLLRRNAKRRVRIDATEFSESDKRIVEHWDIQTAAHSIDLSRRLRKAKREAILMLPAPRKEAS